MNFLGKSSLQIQRNFQNSGEESISESLWKVKDKKGRDVCFLRLRARLRGGGRVGLDLDSLKSVNRMILKWKISLFELATACCHRGVEDWMSGSNRNVF